MALIQGHKQNKQEVVILTDLFLNQQGMTEIECFKNDNKASNHPTHKEVHS